MTERREAGARGMEAAAEKKGRANGWHPEVLLHSDAFIPSVGTGFPVPGAVLRQGTEQ